MKTGAYFYPLTIKCEAKRARGTSIGCNPIDETKLVQKATKLFRKHQQPNIYTLGNKDITTWDDSDPDAIAIQVELARNYGLNFFIFDTYIGKRSGKFVHEMAKPLDENFKKYPGAKAMEFAIMLCMESPRVVFPQPRVRGYVEPNRSYEYDAISARYIVNKCVRDYWKERNYLFIDGKPYVSLFFPSNFSKNRHLSKRADEFINEFLSYSTNIYKIEPYLVGVLRNIDELSTYLAAGVTKFTGYQHLVDFDINAPPLQDYMQMLEIRKKEWDRVISAGGVMIPPTVVGWDSSPRGEHNLTLEDVGMCYPYTPILVNATPKTFKVMLRSTRDFIKTHIPGKEQYSIICSWNEVSEGNALLPKLVNETLDFGYLETLSEVVNSQT